MLLLFLRLKLFKANICVNLGALLGLKFRLVQCDDLWCVLSLNGHEVRVVLKRRSPATAGRERGAWAWKTRRKGGKGNFPIEVKSCGESFILSRSSEQAGTIENSGYELSVLGGHSRATARAPWIC